MKLLLSDWKRATKDEIKVSYLEPFAEHSEDIAQLNVNYQCSNAILRVIATETSAVQYQEAGNCIQRRFLYLPTMKHTDITFGTVWRETCRFLDANPELRSWCPYPSIILLPNLVWESNSVEYIRNNYLNYMQEKLIQRLNHQETPHMAFMFSSRVNALGYIPKEILLLPSDETKRQLSFELFFHLGKDESKDEKKASTFYYLYREKHEQSSLPKLLTNYILPTELLEQENKLQLIEIKEPYGETLEEIKDKNDRKEEKDFKENKLNAQNIDLKEEMKNQSILLEPQNEGIVNIAADLVEENEPKVSEHQPLLEQVQGVLESEGESNLTCCLGCFPCFAGKK